MNAVMAFPWVAVSDEALVMAGAWSTVSVKFCVAVPPVLLAVNVRWYTPPCPTPGVPARVAVPFPLSVQVRPCGSAPASVMVGAGAPVVLTVKLNDDPSWRLLVAALVIVGLDRPRSGRTTGSYVPAEFLAVSVMGYVPPLAAVGVPDQGGRPVAVIAEADARRQSTRMRDAGGVSRGRAARSRDGEGEGLPGWSQSPLAALVKFGTGTFVPAAFTVRVNGWVVVPPLFFAIRVMA